MKFNTIIFFLASILFSNSIFGQIKAGESIDKIIAVVNDQVILKSDFKDKKLTEKDSCITDCDLLKKLLIDKMLVAKAEKDSIMVSDEEVENEVSRRMEYFISIFGSQDKLEKYYEKTIDQLKIYFKDDVRDKLRADRTKAKLFGSIQPSPKEVTDFFNSIDKDSIPYINSELKLQQIVFFPKITRENKRKAREKALIIHRKLLLKEADLGTQAILYSDDQGSAAKGGELGWINHGEMVPEFEQAAYSTKVGELSDIIETRYGYHILEVLDKKNEKVRVRHILISPKSDDKDYTDVALLADSVFNMLKSGKIQFEKAVEIYSDDDIFKQFGGILFNMKTRSSTFDIADLDPELRENIANLKVGQFTGPIEYTSPQNGKVGYRIVKVIQETPPHKLSLQTDYNKIKDMYLEKFLAKETKNWFENYRHLLYMRVDPDYSYCPDLKDLSLR